MEPDREESAQVTKSIPPAARPWYEAQRAALQRGSIENRIEQRRRAAAKADGQVASVPAEIAR